MHHHVHAPCPVPPHIRAHHMAPPPPHMNNGPPVPPTSATANVTPQQPAHLRDHHQRSGNPHFQTNMQLQKLRQQHQHLNNNNNNSTNKSNYHQPPQYNHVPHMAPPATQQKQSHLNIAPQRHPSAHHHQPHLQAQPQAHMKGHAQQQQQQIQAAVQHATNPMPANNVKSNSNNIVINNNQHQAQASQHQQPPHPSIPQQHQPQAHYYGNNILKYNNSKGMLPKSILQNPNRTLKPRPHTSTVNNIEVNTTTSIMKSGDVSNVNNNNNNNNDKNIVSTPDGIDDKKVATTQSASDALASTAPIKDASEESNKENIHLATTSNKSAEPTASCSSNNDVSDSTKNKNSAMLLSNEDNSVAKNSKEKTPMCLVNELARFNKITHQYRLTGEKGPAHSKQFTVTLTLGDEEYSAEGYKIKKAQHLAAAEAIQKTKYEHPVPKLNRRNDDGSGSRANITPTVELNALAMKLGQRTFYLFDPRQMTPADAIGPPPEVMLPPYGVPPPPPQTLGSAGGHMLPPHPLPPHPRMLDPSFMRRNGGYVPPPMPHPAQQRFGHRPYIPRYHQRYPMLPPPPPPPGAHNGMMPGHHSHPAGPFGLPVTPCKVTLIVGKQKFVGIGRTLQQAKHDAAARALQVLKTQATNQLNEILNNSLEESSSKSPISLVHEIGLKRNMQVHFKVLREEGPAHMKNFITACIVGSIMTEGEGNGKKISKKRAAEKMMEELKKLPPLTPTKSPVKHIKMKAGAKGSAGTGGTPNNKSGFGERRKRAGASIKEKTDTDSDLDNPITRLIQLQQSRKEKEPVFEMIAKNGNENSRRREFIIEVTAQGMVARGTGSSKKLAKRNAAHNLLVAMGVEDTTNSGGDSQSKQIVEVSNVTAAASDSTKSNGNNSLTVVIAEKNAVEIIDPNMDVPIISTPAGHVPGILILRQNKKHAAKKKEALTSNGINSILGAEDSKKKEIAKTTATTTTTTDPVTPVTAAVSTDNVSNAIVTSVVTKNVESVNTTSSKQPADSVIGIGTGTTPADGAVSDVVTSTTTTTASSTNTTSNTSNGSGSTTTTTSSSGGVHMKDHLLYLAKLLGFEVNFSDYPKGNHNEFLTIVTLSTNPPQICHGVGISSEESQNDAAKNALKILSELGLNSAKK